MSQTATDAGSRLASEDYGRLCDLVSDLQAAAFDHGSLCVAGGQRLADARMASQQARDGLYDALRDLFVAGLP